MKREMFKVSWWFDLIKFGFDQGFKFAWKYKTGKAIEGEDFF